MFQGEHLIIANVGDSRAVLATTSEDGTLTPLQLTTDLKPNLPSIFSLFYIFSHKKCLSLLKKLMYGSDPYKVCIFS